MESDKTDAKWCLSAQSLPNLSPLPAQGISAYHSKFLVIPVYCGYAGCSMLSILYAARTCLEEALFVSFRTLRRAFSVPALAHALKEEGP